MLAVLEAPVAARFLLVRVTGAGAVLDADLAEALVLDAALIFDFVRPERVKQKHQRNGPKQMILIAAKSLDIR